MENEDFRRFGHLFVDWIADYFAHLERFPILSAVQPGDIKRKLPASPPAGPEPMDKIFRDFEDIIMPGIMHWQHPGWFAYFPANNSPASVLAEMLTAGLGVQGMIWQTSPSATELEEVVLDWLRQMIGLPPGFAGVIQDTASTASLCALISARERATDFGVNECGFQKGLTVYASEEAHSSIEKGVKIAGYGRNRLRHIPTDARLAMIPARLEEAVLRDKAAGLVPACAVATVGTTSSGAIDPVRAVADICRRHGLWLHVDAAYAGSAAVCPEFRRLLDGCEHADSMVTNPHKWMLTQADCSVFYTSRPDVLRRAFSLIPPYLETARDPRAVNLMDYGVPLGRRFRALKLWFVMRSYGREGLARIIRNHVELAQEFGAKVQADPRFEFTAPVSLSVVCFRYKGSDDDNLRIQQQVNESGEIFISGTRLNGQFTLRLTIGNVATERRHVERAWELVKAAV